MAPKYFFVPFPGATPRDLSNGDTHFFLGPIVAETLSKTPILTGIPSVRIHSAVPKPI